MPLVPGAPTLGVERTRDATATRFRMMPLPPLLTDAEARRWLTAHASRCALARPLLVLVPADGGRGAPRARDVATQGARVFANWRALARVVSGDPPPDDQAAGLLPPADQLPDGDDAMDLVAMGEPAARLRASLGRAGHADAAALARAHHVLLVNPRRGARAAARWLALEDDHPSQAFMPVTMFPLRPGRPALATRATRRLPRVRSLCEVRPAGREAAHVQVVTRWRDEGAPLAEPPPRADGRWSRAHGVIAIVATFAHLVDVESSSPAAIRA